MTIYCAACGKDLPGDANFCLRCGAPAADNAASDATGARWEIPRTRCKVLKTDRFSRICKCVLVLDAIGPAGTYIADQSSPFDYYFGYNPLVRGSRYMPINENRTTRAAFEVFVAKIVADGWEPVAGYESWYQVQFRRRVKLTRAQAT